MVIFLLNKILLITFMMCVFNCLKHVWEVINNLRKEVPNKYHISPKERFLLGVSLSYIITSILTGIVL
jgi:hypothetical protein